MHAWQTRQISPVNSRLHYQQVARAVVWLPLLALHRPPRDMDRLPNAAWIACQMRHAVQALSARMPAIRMEHVTSQFAALAVDCADPQILSTFWCEALGWDVIDSDETGFSIASPDGSGPTIDLISVPERKTAKNRLHIDLRADGCTTDEELDRLLRLGAVRVDVGQGPDVSWVVLADPEGNEFCLLSRTVQEVMA